MASKYLKYQDKNGDGLPDVCDVDIQPETKVCELCKPNPLAVVRNWRKSNQNEPTLNEKLCKYQITYVTKETSTGYETGMTEPEAKEALDKIYEENAQDAVFLMLEEFGKDNSPASVSKIMGVLEYSGHHIETRNKSRLKLLYSADFDSVFNLPDADFGNDEEEKEEPADIKVKYTAEDMTVMSIKIRKGLNLHSKFYRVYRAIEGGTLKFVDSGAIFNIEDYGDAALFTNNSALANVVQELDSWLNTRGYNLPGTGRLSFFNDKVIKIDFLFDGEYNLKRMKIFTEGCGQDRPKQVFNKKRMRSLLNSSAWKDRTAVAYFAQMKNMDRDLSARRPKPWIEFVTEYTYPKVTTTKPEVDDELREQQISTCIQDALANDFKQLGQDIFDEVFSLSDAIAYAFHKSLCRTEVSQVVEDRYGTGTNNDLPVAGADQNVYATALVQATKEVNEKDAVLEGACLRMLSFRSSGSPLQQLDQMWAQGFGRLKVCGLMDLMLEAIQCMFKGLSMEDVISSSVRAALAAMNVEDFGSLFVGLPPDKQAELDALVQKKIETGNIFPPGSPGQSTSDNIAQRTNTGDAPFLGKLNIQKPWQNEKFVERQNRNLRTGNYGNSVPTKSATFRDDIDLVERRTLAKQITNPAAGANQPDPNVVMQAYAAALIEVYQDNLFGLIDELDKFPGAQIISMAIALTDCPSPPLFNPGVMDFVKSIELPFCRNTQDIVMPRWENPFAYLPKISDILRLLFDIISEEVKRLVIRIIKMILAKICEMIGDAICKALELAGDVIASLPAILSGRERLSDVIRETICGPNASAEQVDKTALDLLEQFGMGGAALADPETAKNFFGDAINSMTHQEALTAMLEGPNETALEVMNNLVEFEYPQYREAFPNKDSFSRFFANVGNLIPAQTISDIKQSLEFAGDGDLPANPSLCATPQKLEDFNNARCALLEGRMSPEQCKAQTESLRDQMLEDLGDLGNVLNQGIGPMIEANMPPLFSDPGCDNGLLPAEPKELQAVNTMALKGDMEKLQVAFTQDMLGNGGIFGGDDWGFINMVLADTQGNPYTAHQRKTFARDTFVDFYVPNDTDVEDNNSYGDFSKTSRQRGAYPKYVAEWLKYQYSGEKPGTANELRNSINFKTNNDKGKTETFALSFRDLGFTGLFGQNVELTRTPDFGYNVKTKVDFENDRVLFRRKARKDTPDIALKFRDNNKGYRSGPNSSNTSFGYGFNLKAYYSDLYKKKDEGYLNRQSDNVRVIVEDIINPAALSELAKDLKTQQEKETETSDKGNEERLLKTRRFEFLAVDDGLRNAKFENFPRLYESFVRYNSHSPQVLAISDITGKPPGICASWYNELQEEVYNNIKTDIGNNDGAWLYGAVFDDLTSSDLDYLAPEGSIGGQYGSEYSDLQVPNYDADGARDGVRDVANDDGVLGISRYQYDVDTGARSGPNRVFYLNPTQFGGNYVNPPLHIVPLTASGWLGMTELLFPDYTPCKPRSTNLVGFDDIQSVIDQAYVRIPEDKRLKTDPDCIMEVPFNRILTRPSRAGIQGLIMALTRIFTSTHFLKSLPVFSTFAPRFPQSYSKIYAAYIVERMEESLRDAGNNFLSPFKDDEFWYAFLEQAVQTYARRVDDTQDGGLNPGDVPPHIQDALNRLNDLQAAYDYPYGNELRAAKSSGDAGLFETLKSYRESKNLEAVQRADEDCKLILQEMVIEQLEAMGERFEDKLRQVGFAPKYTEMDYYFLENFVGGAGDLNLNGKFVEKAVDLPTTGDNLYTSGSTFALPDGMPYTGEYHVHTDADGEPLYMVGPEHVSSLHDPLTPMAEHVRVAIEKNGTLAGIGTIRDDADLTKNFYVKKHILVDNNKYSNAAATTLIRSANNGVGNISDSFPGTLHLVNRAQTSEVIGIEGNIGVQYALEFGIVINGASTEITTVTVDALDLPVNKFKGIEADSKILLCLINNLRDDPKFRMAVDYIAGINKSLSMYAIYNDMAFMPSIGEYTVAAGDSHGWFNPTDAFVKPGGRIEATTGLDGVTSITVDYTDGWAAENDRNGFFASPFFMKWDEWDQEILRKSVRTTKRLFRQYYRIRKFTVDDADGPSAADLFQKQLIERFRISPGANFLPWWKLNRLRTSPFNAKGQLCKKEE